MSYLTYLSIVQFKSHLAQQITVHKRITAFTGKNGSGKTNLLDAIHYACFARSYFTKNDKIICIEAHSGFRVEALFKELKEEHQVVCIYREDGKKEIRLNDELIPKISAYFGKFSAVMIAPDDIAMINEGSENRRKWLDSILCQIDKTYLAHLQQYQKIIAQRNALLKLMFEKNEKSNTILDYYDQQLLEHSTYIYDTRCYHWKQLNQLIMKYYQIIAGKDDNIQINYESKLHSGSIAALLKMNFQKDLMSQRTNYGIHKDELNFTLQNEPLKQVGSQGQKKSFLLAIKLAELYFLTTNLNREPILLLDDIFERLDTERIKSLFHYLATDTNCQVFITDTDKERVKENLSFFMDDFEIITL